MIFSNAADSNNGGSRSILCALATRIQLEALCHGGQQQKIQGQNQQIQKLVQSQQNIIIQARVKIAELQQRQQLGLNN